MTTNDAQAESPRETAVRSAVAKCIVPEWMENDPLDPVTQEQFTRGLLRSARELWLSVAEIEDIAAGRIPRGQLRSYVPCA